MEEKEIVSQPGTKMIVIPESVRGELEELYYKLGYVMNGIALVSESGLDDVLTGTINALVDYQALLLERFEAALNQMGFKATVE